MSDVFDIFSAGGDVCAFVERKLTRLPEVQPAVATHIRLEAGMQVEMLFQILLASKFVLAVFTHEMPHS